MPEQNEEKLDQIHHLAINVADLEKSIKWYQQSFNCRLIFQAKAQAILEFANVKLTLVLPSAEPLHLAFCRKDAKTLGTLRERVDGVNSTFIADPTGNVIEVIEG